MRAPCKAPAEPLQDPITSAPQTHPVTTDTQLVPTQFLRNQAVGEMMEGRRRNADQNSHQSPPAGLRPQDRKPLGIWLQDTGQDRLTAFPELTRLDTVACCPALLGGIECKLFPE